MKKSFIVLGLLLCSTLSFAQQNVKLGVIEVFPYSYTEAGKITGTAVTAIDTILKKAGLGLETESVPAKRLFDGLVDGSIHLWAGVSTVPVLADKTYLSDIPLFTIKYSAFKMGDKAAIKTKEDFSGKSLIVIRGYSYGGWINYLKDPANKVALQESDSHDSALAMLKAGRADYLLDINAALESSIAKAKVENVKSDVVLEQPCFIHVSKKTPNAEAVKEKIYKALKELTASGAIKI